MTTTMGWDRSATVYWSGRAVSTFGSEMTGVVVPLLALRTANVPASVVAGMTILRYLPGLLAPLYVGPLVDRLNRLHILIFCDVIRVGALIALAAALQHPQWSIIALFLFSSINGTAAILSTASAGGLLQRLVPKDQRLHINGRIASTSSLASIVGPLAGTALVATTGPYVVLILDAVTFIVGAASCYLIPQWRKLPRMQRSSAAMGDKFGFKQILSSHPLRFTMLFQSLLNLITGLGESLILVHLARDVHLDPFAYGVIFSMIAIGAIASGHIIVRLKRWRKGTDLVYGFPLFSCATSYALLGSNSLTKIPVSIYIYIASLGALLFGLAVVSSSAISATLRQDYLQQESFGSGSAALRFFTSGAVVLGAICSALILTVGTAGTWVATAGAVALVSAIILIRLARKYLPVDSQAEFG